MDRARLVGWLDAAVRPASRWTDWREMGGQYYNSGVQHLSDFSDADMVASLVKADAALFHYRDYRSAVRGIMNSAEMPHLKRASYVPDTRDFVAGSLTYAENLIEYIVFYAIVRGAADMFTAGDYGVAVIHNYIWGNDRTTHSAMRLGPGARSEFMSPDEVSSAGGAFQGIADEMLSEDHPPAPIDELDSLR
jgi:hypothetical protein